MRKSCFILLLIVLTNIVYAITVDGNAFLENQTDHSGIEVFFERITPYYLSYIVYTNSSGFYTSNIETGVYNITYLKADYFSESIIGQSLYSNSTLSDVTLFEHTTILNVPTQFSSIQEAINYSCNSDTVLVQPGIYYENINFNGKTIIVASNFLTTRDTSYISQTIIDGNHSTSVVSIENAEEAGTKLCGFTIRNGRGTGDWPSVRGGGIHVSNLAQPEISFCYIHDNSCYGDSNRGAGIYANSSYTYILNCIIYNNISNVGAAISIGNGCNGVQVNECEIFDNISTYPYNFLSGIIYIGYSSNTTILRTLIHHNVGSGIRNYRSDNTNIINCTISDNTGYGIYNSGDYSYSDMYALNSIISYNSVSNVENDTSMGVNNWINCEYSDILEETGQTWFGQGCIDTNPLYFDPTQNNYNLSPESPCIDTGDPNSPLDPDSTIADMGCFYFDQLTGIDDNELPVVNSKLKNYPNPFNPSTTIEFSINNDSRIELSVYNIKGQKVKTLANNEFERGNHSIIWNGDDESNKFVSSGLYYYKLTVNGKTRAVNKCLLLK